MKNKKIITEIINYIIYITLICFQIIIAVNCYHILNEDKKTNLEIENQQNFKIPYKKYMGKFTATFYCDCPKCVGHKKQIRTAVGNIPYPNKTIAVDKNIIPLHSIVYIKDMGFFVAEDTGGAIKGNKIDIFVHDHDHALKLGKQTVEIYLLN